MEFELAAPLPLARFVEDDLGQMPHHHANCAVDIGADDVGTDLVTQRLDSSLDLFDLSGPTAPVLPCATVSRAWTESRYRYPSCRIAFCRNKDAPLLQLGQLLRELVVEVEAIGEVVGDRVCLPQHAVDVCGSDALWVVVEGEAVPVAVECVGERAHLIERGAGRHDDAHGVDENRRRGVGEKAGAHASPAAFERQLRPHRVDDRDARGYTGFEWMLTDDAGGERMQGADGRGVDLFEGTAGTFGVVLSQLDSDSFAKFGCGLLGERDGGDPIEFDAVVQDEPADAADQGVGFAAAGAGFDEQGGGGVGGDPIAGCLVGKRECGHVSLRTSVHSRRFRQRPPTQPRHGGVRRGRGGR